MRLQIQNSKAANDGARVACRGTWLRFLWNKHTINPRAATMLLKNAWAWEISTWLT